MTADPAVRAKSAIAEALATRASTVPVATVITDLITAHRSWRDAAVDRVIVPSEEMAARCARDGMPADRCVPLGLPVAAEFSEPPLSEAERKELKRELGIGGDFLVVLTGGAEGSGGLRRRAAAITRHVDDVDIAVICGRNKVLKRRVTRLARRTERHAASPASSHAVGRALRRVRRTARPTSTRLTAHGFVGNMADWLRCADIVVGKAGPGTIAEATCCGAPLVLTSFVPGQEKGNAEFVTAAGAGVYASRPRHLAAEIGRLRRDPSALAAMRAAAVSVSRPRAATDIARFLADLSGSAGQAAPEGAAGTAGGSGGQAARDLLPTLIAD
jgi:1,2-diacylglycerol 3-beta-galactosyltransferase